jgi:streptogramin lyase
MQIKQIVCVLLVVLGCTSIAAQACRPFGSYQFAEDEAGGIWFTEGDNNAISRMAPDSTVTSHKLPTANAEPSSLALDHDGNVWFAEMNSARIGRLNKDGSIVEFPTTGGHPFQVTVDADGEAWFIQMADHQGGAHAGHSGGSGVGHVDRQGQMHFYPVSEGWPTSIVFDSRNQAWVSILISGDKPRGKLARLSRDGVWRVEASWKNSCPRNLLASPDGKVHFTDGCRIVAGYRAADGKLVERKLPADTNIQQTSLAKDGTVWFTDRKHLGRIDPAGKVNIVERADNGDATMAVLALVNGDVVFSEFYNYNINRLKYTGEFVEHLVSIDERHSSREVKEGEFCRIEFGARIASKAEMDKKRAEEVKSGHLKPDGAGTEKLAEQKCMVCHDTRRLLLSRRSDWTPSITRMHNYRTLRNVEPLTAEETARLVHYFNTQYGLAP